MKRFLSLVLSLAMILSIMLAATPALAEENPYAEHLTFKVFTIDGSDDMFNWPLVKQAMEKFNFDFEIQLVAWDSWDESTRTLAYTQSLPEVIAWYNLNKDEYLEWVEEGVFKALPDDMSAYPNLEKLINSYTCFDQFRVDGKLYTFPKIKNGNPVNLYTTYMFAYRRDWAKAMGYDWAPVQTLTYDEFVTYLRDVKEKDPGHMGDKLVPLDLDNGGKHWAMLAQLWNQRIGSFDIVDGQYYWSAEDPSSLEAIKQIKTLYDDGLLAMDSYNDSNNAGRERFLAGRSAVLYGNLGATILQTTARTLATNVEGEQIETYAYGVKGEDWDYDADGNVVLNYTDEDIAATGSKYYIVQERAFQKYFICEGLDVYLPGNPSYSSYIINDLFTTNMETWATNATFAATDYNLTNTKNEEYYSFRSAVINNIRDIIIQAVISDDPETVWNDFVNEHREEGDKLAAELTEEFLK